MEIHHRDVDIVEELGVELDRIAGRKENDNLLLLHVLLEEGEEEEETALRRAHDVALLKALDGGCGAVLLNVDVQGSLFQ